MTESADGDLAVGAVAGVLAGNNGPWAKSGRHPIAMRKHVQAKSGCGDDIALEKLGVPGEGERGMDAARTFLDGPNAALGLRDMSVRRTNV